MRNTPVFIVFEESRVLEEEEIRFVLERSTELESFLGETSFMLQVAVTGTSSALAMSTSFHLQCKMTFPQEYHANHKTSENKTQHHNCN